MSVADQLWCIEKAEFAIENGAPNAAKILLDGSDTERHAKITREIFEAEFGPSTDSTKETE